MTSYKDAPVWQHAMQLAAGIYSYTAQLPAVERLNLSLAMQQAAVRVPATIASGSRSGSKTGLRAACLDSLVALAELETLLIIAGQQYPDVQAEPLFQQHDQTDEQVRLLLRRLSQSPKSI